MIKHTAQTIKDRVDAVSPALEIATKAVNDKLLDTDYIRSFYPRFTVYINKQKLTVGDKEELDKQLTDAGFANIEIMNCSDQSVSIHFEVE